MISTRCACTSAATRIRIEFCMLKKPEIFLRISRHDNKVINLILMRDFFSTICAFDFVFVSDILSFNLWVHVASARIAFSVAAILAETSRCISLILVQRLRASTSLKQNKRTNERSLPTKLHYLINFLSVRLMRSDWTWTGQWTWTWTVMASAIMSNGCWLLIDYTRRHRICHHYHHCLRGRSLLARLTYLSRVEQVKIVSTFSATADIPR